jgi:hypothetical protein
LQGKQGQQQQSPSGRHPKVDHQPQHHHKGNHKVQQLGQHRRQGQHHAGEIYLGDHIGILDQGVGRLGQGSGEIIPGPKGQVGKEDIRHPVRIYLCQSSKDNGKDDGGKERLYNGPGHSQYGLGIAGLDSPKGKEVEQVFVAPQFPEIYEFPAGAGFYDFDVWVDGGRGLIVELIN